ncbi:MAG: exosome complex protein Rrp42 [Candidatus Nanoarchaeia archaeon]|nr:exosome complex protein Rrp42 [Candidatus Nanoarchaeia archaeon]MDD5588395.1 exosome complex protein Rrp42 [Candidatus Nanoarchaeia archaeon]
MKSHVHTLAEKGFRLDNRKFDEYRPVKVEYSPLENAEGSARVTMGKTVVLAGVKMEVGTPFPDTPDDGVLMVNSELLPLANPDFESGPPSIEAIELSRVVDRGIRESGTIDTKKLCIKKGEKVWMVLLDIYPMNDDGNLFDAAALAGIAALQDAKLPEYKDEKVDYTKKTSKGIPLSKVPVECTVVKIDNHLFIDPSREEEKAADARLTIATIGKQLCAMQKGGDQALTDKEIEEMVDLAVKKTEELRKLLKK